MESPIWVGPILIHQKGLEFGENTMKNLFLIGGTMGIGKSTVSGCLKHKLPNSVFLDGDWCWDAEPFVVTEETKKMVMGNICFLLNSFLKCGAYENIIFCWVMHQQPIIDEILSRLNLEHARIFTISLTGSREELTRRLEKDIEAGVRSADVMERSLGRIPLYQQLDTIKIDTSGKSPEEIAEEIRSLLQ